MKTFITTISLAILVGLTAFWLHAIPGPSPMLPPAPASQSETPEPPPPTPSPQTDQPTITWSVPQLSATMFPGTSSTTAVTFRSSQALTNVAVDIAPSLNGIISTSPGTFPSINANQDYTLNFTATAPQAFVKRSFGGTVQLRNAAGPPRVYAPPLSITLQIAFSAAVINSLQLFYPTGFSVNSDPSTHITRVIANGLPNTPALILQTTSQSPTLPDLWFASNVDPGGTLISSGSVQRLIQDDGSVLYLFLSSPGPAYIDSHGPLPLAFIISRDGTRVISVVGSSEGDALYSLGYSELQAAALRFAIIDSITMK